MKKPKDIELSKELNIVDTGANWHGVVSKGNIEAIGFDDDTRGNGEGAYIRLRLYKTYARFDLGNDLTTYEKKRKIYYEDYEDLSSFVDEIADITKDFFFSFYRCRRIVE